MLQLQLDDSNLIVAGVYIYFFYEGKGSYKKVELSLDLLLKFGRKEIGMIESQKIIVIK